MIEALPLVLFALVAMFSAVLREGRLFVLLADPAERRSGQLVGLTEFTSAGAILAAAALLGVLPIPIFVGTMLLVGIGALGAELARIVKTDRLIESLGFIMTGFVGYVAGHALAAGGTHEVGWLVGFLAMAGSLGGALSRSVIWARHDGIVLLLLGAFLGGLSMLPEPSGQSVTIAIIAAIVLAYLALWIGAASVAGMLTGVLLIFLTIVLGGLTWVLLLITFFIVGGLATKYRYEEKRFKGIAEPNRGARGSGNVLGNTAVAMLAVLGYAAVAADDPTLELVFLFVYAGSLATALSDTLSSEIGGLYDDPLLITSFDRVRPGTNGAVSVRGTLAGMAGAAAIAGLVMFVGPVGVAGAFVVLVAGTLGMMADSFLGATLEDRLIGNHAVNAGATAVGGLLAGVVPYVGLV